MIVFPPCFMHSIMYPNRPTRYHEKKHVQTEAPLRANAMQKRSCPYARPHASHHAFFFPAFINQPRSPSVHLHAQRVCTRARRCPVHVLPIALSACDCHEICNAVDIPAHDGDETKKKYSYLRTGIWNLCEIKKQFCGPIERIHRAPCSYDKSCSQRHCTRSSWFLLLY